MNGWREDKHKCDGQRWQPLSRWRYSDEWYCTPYIFGGVGVVPDRPFPNPSPADR